MYFKLNNPSKNKNFYPVTPINTRISMIPFWSIKLC